ncbi:MAG: agmatinase [Rhodospirillaceae bacterium]|nr:agmatinase [Rhodospirillaceae bacterium]
MTDLKQTDVTAVPRFANVATFMRAQLRDTPEGLDIAMFGVPLDLGSSFRSGARHGPAQVREMSRLIREVNYSTKIAPFDLCDIADIGDAPVNSLDLDASLRSIQHFVQTVLSVGARPLAVGGDHTISLPILRSMAADGALAIIQVDAHSDTQDLMLGKKYASGTPFRRAIEEGLINPRKTVQVGVRGTLFSADELDWALAQGTTIIDMDEFEALGAVGAARKARQVVAGSDCYLSFDIDALDPGVAPGAGGLEPGGISARQAQVFLRELRGLPIAGADVVEVSPPLDPSGGTALVAANLMFEILCLLAECHKIVSD